MKLNHLLFDQMRDLLGKGPTAATAAIQRALSGMHPPRATAPTPAPAASATTAAPTMRDINPPPAAAPNAAPARRAMDSDAPQAKAHAEPAPDAAPGFDFGGDLNGGLSGNPAQMAQDLMARMGITPELQANMAANLQSNLKNFELKNFDLKNFEMPGFDFSSLDRSSVGTPAAPDLPPNAQFISGVYRNHAGTRNYKLYIPSGYHGQAMPLLVMLHGCTQDPDDFAAGTQMNAVAEEQQCFVVYPEQGKNANSSKCWNWFNAIDQQRGQGEPSLIAGIAQQVIDDYPVNERQVYVAGLSAGGAMAVIVGTLYPDVFAAVGVHSGLPYASAQDLPSALMAMKRGAGPVPQAPHSKGGLPIIVFHGDRDTTVHPRNGEDVMEQGLSGAGAQAAPSVQSDAVPNGHRYTQTTHRGTDGAPLAEHWLIHGAGHAWSGGSARGSYTDDKGPDASREMMRFFKTVS
ncbi:PHB depolymerase family esterase [Rugamonas sp.]|uniref:extracellular catalytic domain type 1 short-chain-length polyhydroxyalkanoate depolymerase n=1 Tax=Rugamonas sp. TaxID=1926287 RepID=UPI0025F5F3C3|nr:PHB depolymerase family esterase [Rugamonas sp.]